MRIHRVLVEGLFGIFDHDIAFNAEERVTIIHGPNGFGKTIILRMLESFLEGRFAIFYSIPFAAFTVTFDDGSDVRLECVHDKEMSGAKKRKKRAARRGKRTKQLHITSSKEPDKPLELPSEDLGELLPDWLELPNGGTLLRMDRDRWMLEETRTILHTAAVEKLYGDRLPPDLRRAAKRTPAWLRALRDEFHVKLIETQRLNVTDEEWRGLPRSAHRRPTVVSYSEELARNIRSLLARYASRSQELDRTFPTRLLKQAAPTPEASELQDKLAALEEKRKHLTGLGFLDPEEGMTLPASRAVEAKRDVLAVYVVDMERKLAVFDDMAAKMELLTSIINDLFLYKDMHIEREKGFVFTSATGEIIEPDDLSSGEQHQLILLYELLFHSQPGSLVLIDEPEISLHVTWQERFLDDLMKMVKLSDFDVLVATHSPEIIGEHWDLVVELRGPNGKKRTPHKETTR